jgi:hypothetical protein
LSSPSCPRRGCRHDLGGVHLRDRVADFHPALLTGGRGDDRSQRGDHGAHLYVRRRGLTSRDRDRQLRLGISDAQDANLVIAGIHATKRELAFDIRLRADVRSDDVHLGRRYGLTGRRVGDATGNGSCLGGLGCGDSCRERSEERSVNECSDNVARSHRHLTGKAVAGGRNYNAAGTGSSRYSPAIEHRARVHAISRA